MKQIKLKVNHFIRNSNKDYIHQYLNALGIDKVESFIGQPDEADEEDPFDLSNMRDAVELAYKILHNPCKVYVQPDSDTDGYTSSAILINYIKRRFPLADVRWKLHPGKEHGIVLEDVPEDTQLVFIPDAGSNQFDEQDALFQRGVKTIILDHHEVDDMKRLQWSPAIIVNNQTSPDYVNKSLSGAGVVYKFIKAMDKTYFNNDHIFHDYGDLAAIGIIADAMNMTTLDNNYIAYWGLSHIHSKFIHELAVKQSRGVKNPDHLTKIDVAFYIAPVINGVIRSGTSEDKQMTFEALIDNEDTNLYEHTWRGTTKMETRWERAARNAINAKSRQDSSKKKSFEWLCEKIRKEGWDNHNIIIAVLDAKESMKVSPNITGLIAMELVKEFNKPALVLRDTELDGAPVYGGSGRNGNFYGLPDLKVVLAKAGGLYQAGHANAFGSFLAKDQVDSVRQYFDTHFSAATFNDAVYEVDYWFHTGEEIDQNMLVEIAEHDELWGNSIPQPKFAFDINYTSDEIRLMGADNSSLKLSHDGVDFVAFKCPELIRQLQEKSSGHISIVGRPQINEWMGRKNIQIIIDDVDVFNDTNVSINDLI